jgi:hypothetical protein
VWKVCSFPAGRCERRVARDSGRQNARDLTWDKFSSRLQGTKSFHDEDEEDDDAGVTGLLRIRPKNKSLRPAFVGQWFDAVPGSSARPVKRGVK